MTANIAWTSPHCAASLELIGDHLGRITLAPVDRWSIVYAECFMSFLSSAELQKVMSRSVSNCGGVELGSAPADSRRKVRGVLY